MADTLYDHDVLVWSEQQAALLRRLAAGELPNGIVDWENVIEEVESVGRSELHACENLLRQAMVHLLKLHAWPGSQAIPHWRGEVVSFLASAQQSFTPSMRQRIDLSWLYQKALNQVSAELDNRSEQPFLPVDCPFELDDLLAGDPDLAALATKLAAALIPENQA